jgi:hypothetical protein
MTANVKDFGAIGDGATDDRAAFQRAIGASSDVFVPNGNYLLSQAPGGDFCVRLNKPGAMICGQSRAGVRLIQAPGLPGSVRTIRCDAPGIIVADMTGDGNKQNQTPDEHRCFVFGQNAQDLGLRGITAVNHTGDGIYIYDRSTFNVHDVDCNGNDRNGMTLGGGTTRGSVTNSAFYGNRAEQFDTEGGVVSNMVLRGNRFVGAPGDYALTISGYSPDALSTNWVVESNRIDGGIAVVWAGDVVIRGNSCINDSKVACLTLYRTTINVTVEDNEFQANALPFNSAVVMVTGTGTGSGSSRARFYNNEFKHAGNIGNVFGARIEGAVSTEIIENTFSGAGIKAPNCAAIYLRATNPREDWVRASVIDNTMLDWGDIGIKVDGNGAAQLRYLEIIGNTFGNTINPAAMVSAMQLNEPNNPTSCARDVVHLNSVLGQGCPQLMRVAPGGVWKAVGDRWTMP